MDTRPIFLLALLANTALAQTPVLVKDINPGVFAGISTISNAAVISRP